jgi:exopolyphosphatase/guanosine-5'-triphosphate,3'-diphosphate pyrophosphatase
MRLGVLDIGSNAAHLRVVDDCAGSPPVPFFRQKVATGLAEAIGDDGTVGASGVRRLVAAVGATVDAARAQHVDELIPYVTSAVRDAPNRDTILAVLRAEVGLDVGFLSGEEEARLTYFAAHRWYGWSSGALSLLDIGGGSMEIAQGRDEEPVLAVSLPLGAGRLTRSHLPDHPADRRQVKRLRAHVAEGLAPLRRRTYAGRVVATSKTFKQLARLTGSRPGARLLHRRDLRAWIPRLAAMTPEERAKLPGVQAARARQLLAGAVVAATAMKVLGVDRVEICPWALREGILLRRLNPVPVPDGLRPVRFTGVTACEVSDLAGFRNARRSGDRNRAAYSRA